MTSLSLLAGRTVAASMFNCVNSDQALSVYTIG